MTPRHPRSIRCIVPTGIDWETWLIKLSQDDARRWPNVGWRVSDCARKVPGDMATVERTMVIALCTEAGLDPDLAAIVGPIYRAWLETPGAEDYEIEAALINTLDAAIDEQDRRNGR